MTDRSAADMAAFYRSYPYPAVDGIEYDFNLIDRLMYLSGMCQSFRSPRFGNRRGKVLIAGCGTREAVTWGFSHPHLDFDAIDLSARSIEISKHLAQQLELTNVNFSLGDISKGEGFNGPYDVIHSYGVLHHLPDPEQGLAQLESQLAEGGLLSIMVYNDTHRIPLQKAQRVIQLLTQTAIGDVSPVEEAGDVVHQMSKGMHRLSHVFTRAKKNYEYSSEQFADTMLNPQEQSYTFKGLLKFLQSSQLALLSVASPLDWDIRDLLTPKQRTTLSMTSKMEQWELGDHLRAPLFWVLAGRANERQSNQKACDLSSSLFWSIIPRPIESGFFPVTRLQLQAPQSLSLRAEKIDSEIIQLWRGDQGIITLRLCEEIIQKVDGVHSLEEITQAVCQAEGLNIDSIRENLEKSLREIIEFLGGATPDLSQCHGCPARCKAP